MSPTHGKNGEHEASALGSGLLHINPGSAIWLLRGAFLTSAFFGHLQFIMCGFIGCTSRSASLQAEQ